MSLDTGRLEKLVELAGGVKKARCPACAEAGQDRTGEHLRIYPDGRFGCCVFPKDHEHRKRIFALVGERGQHGIAVQLTQNQGAGVVKAGIFGRIGRTFGGGEFKAKVSDGSDGVKEVRDEECGGQSKTRTPRTGETKLGQVVMDYSRTGRTPTGVVTGEKSVLIIEEGQSDFVKAVRSVRENRPHILGDGTLVIPFESPERFHWWRGGQSITETRQECLRTAITRKEHDAITL